MECYIGLMSGTSIDGIDAALVDFAGPTPAIIATHYIPYTAQLSNSIRALCEKGENEIERMGELDRLLGTWFADAVLQLLNKATMPATSIIAIGSHGQTIRHHKSKNYPFSLQIGDPNTITALTGITTIADFRGKDIALGGQGAPLVPAFHRELFSHPKHARVIVNIGGIANITLLPPNQTEKTFGFDTGPGNVLLDLWIQAHKQETHDKNGAWAQSGQYVPSLLQQLLSDPYFHTAAPKSTGREYFNLSWLQSHLDICKLRIQPTDVQATLVELTASTLLAAINPNFKQGEILVCGGGVHNDFLMQRLQDLAQDCFTVTSTQKYGIDPDWVEAMAFAWLARQTVNRRPGNLPSVTGASRETVLGCIYSDR